MKLVGVREAAAILGWAPAKVSTYHVRGKLPQPIETLASGPVWLEAQIKAYKEAENMVELVQTLSGEMVRVFGSWVHTPSQDLLEDGGTVIDWLRNESDKLQGVNLDDIPEDVWLQAWDVFNHVMGI